MRILADLSSDSILQVEKTPELNDPVAMNGKYIISVPEGSAMDVDSSSYIQPVDGNDVSSLAFAGLLAQYPQYGNIVFNPLLTAGDVADLDLTALGPSSEITRCQTGRGSGPAATGQAPTTTAILGQNGLATPARPGCMVTDTIDISAATSGVGADEFMVYWKLYDYSVSQDVVSSYGATSGQNDPAIKSILEIDQEPGDLTVYLSVDDGANYTPVGLLEPVAFCIKGTNIRLAFVNTGAAKLYVACYAILF